MDLGLLLRHIASSLESLSISPDAPEYLIAARLRCARFEDLLLTPDRLELVEALEEQERARILIAAIRNSDILLDEIASRIPGYSVENRARAMEQARLNLRILRETIERLSLSDIAVPPLTAVTLAAQVQRTLREKEMHSEPSDGSHAD